MGDKKQFSNDNLIISVPPQTVKEQNAGFQFRNESFFIRCGKQRVGSGQLDVRRTNSTAAWRRYCEKRPFMDGNKILYFDLNKGKKKVPSEKNLPEGNQKKLRN